MYTTKETNTKHFRRSFHVTLFGRGMTSTMSLFTENTIKLQYLTLKSRKCELQLPVKATMLLIVASFSVEDVALGDGVRRGSSSASFDVHTVSVLTPANSVNRNATFSREAPGCFESDMRFHRIEAVPVPSQSTTQQTNDAASIGNSGRRQTRTLKKKNKKK